MINRTKNILLLAAAITLLLGSFELTAKPANWKPAAKDKGEELQKARTYRTYDQQQNTVSNIQFYTSNYGIFGLDIDRNTGGCFWPRGSLNQYIFAGGLWFAAQKVNPKDPAAGLRKYCSVTYDPNNGSSWMVPGRIVDKDGKSTPGVDDTDPLIYRTYFSTDFNKGTGEPYATADRYNWPIWDSKADTSYHLKFSRYFGYYEVDDTKRNSRSHDKGPAFISEEDIFSTYKDTELSRYVGGAAKAKNAGYPMNLQFEQMIYSWGFGQYKDFIFLKYDIINMSKDTLRECWMAPLMDVDIAVAPFTSAGADNDQCRYYDEDPSLNLAIQWSQTTQQEGGKGFGYLGFDFLESPAVYKADGLETIIENGEVVEKAYMCVEQTAYLAGEINPYTGQPVENDTMICTSRNYFDKDLDGFVRKDKRFYRNDEQLGLKTFKNWNIEEDYKEDYQRYDVMSSGARDGDLGPGDKRFMMATGPFNVAPGDTVRTVVCVLIANAAVKKECDGSTDDLKETVARDKFAQAVYDNNFRAPLPPDNTFFTGYKSFNNSISITWDETAEMSNDKEEKGLDFMGYKLFRSRNPYLDTFATGNINPDRNYPKGRGPYGWKEIASWSIRTPFVKSERKMGAKNDDADYGYIDSLQIVGLAFDNQDVLDTFAIRVMRIPQGLKYVDHTYMNADSLRLNLSTGIPSELGNWLSANKPDYDATNPKIYGSGICTPFVWGLDTGVYSAPWSHYYLKAHNDTATAPIYFDSPQLPFRTNGSYWLDSIVLGTVRLNKSLLPYNPLLWNKTYERVNYTPADLLDTNFIKTVKQRDGDTLFLINTIFKSKLYPDVEYSIEKMVPLFSRGETSSITLKQLFRNSNHLNAVLDSIMVYLQDGRATVEFGDFEASDSVRKNVIVPYMFKVTNGRTFVDIGDDDGSGSIELSDKSTETEKLLNNIPYYYKLEAYDEGDYNQPTPMKMNDGSEGRTNFIEAEAKASRPNDKVEFEILPVDNNIMGGLRNFKFFSLDDEKVAQKLAGRTLELSIDPKADIYTFVEDQGNNNKVYHYWTNYERTLTVRDSLSKELLYQANTWFEEELGKWYYSSGWSENTISLVLSDSIYADPVTLDTFTWFQKDYRRKFQKSGKFTTGDFTVPGYAYAKGFASGYSNIFGFSFDYTFEQQGGVYRGDDAEGANVVIKGDNSVALYPFTPIVEHPLDGNQLPTTLNLSPLAQYVGSEDMGTTINIANTYKVTNGNEYRRFGWWDVRDGKVAQFNNGPGKYLITFKEGGYENITVTWGHNDAANIKEATFNVPYLNYEIVNNYSIERKEHDGSITEIKYGYPLGYMEVPDTASMDIVHINGFSRVGWIGEFPHPRNLLKKADEFMGHFTSFAVGFVNSRGLSNNALDLRRVTAGESGKEFNFSGINRIGQKGKYYKSAGNSNNDTLDFLNVININGVTFGIDYVYKGKLNPSYSDGNSNLPNVREHVYGPDFQVGDQIQLSTTGGAFGFPMPGAKVYAKVKVTQPKNNEYTESQLDQIKVVPNPYYITHEGQKSSYDTKLYFTKLPSKCTIDIYTVTGDLVKTINHDEPTYVGNYNDSYYAADIWDLYSRNGQRIQSQTFVAVISTPNGEKAIHKFTVLVGSSRLITED